MVPALQPGLERWGREPAESARPQDRLPLDAHAHPRRADQHPGALRAGRRDHGPEDGQEAEGADLAALPPARRGAPAAGRRVPARRREAVSHPAFSRQREVELHRLACAPVNWTADRRRGGVRLHHRGDRPAPPRPADSRHDQAVRPGRGHRRPCRPLGRPPHVARGREEDHHLDGPEVPIHPRRDRERAAGPTLRHPHRRGAFEPGRQGPRPPSAWRSPRRGPRKRTRPPRTGSTAS